MALPIIAGALLLARVGVSLAARQGVRRAATSVALRGPASQRAAARIASRQAATRARVGRPPSRWTQQQQAASRVGSAPGGIGRGILGRRGLLGLGAGGGVMGLARTLFGSGGQSDSTQTQVDGENATGEQLNDLSTVEGQEQAVTANESISSTEDASRTSASSFGVAERLRQRRTRRTGDSGSQEYVTYPALYSILENYVTAEAFASYMSGISERVEKLNKSTTTLASIVAGLVNTIQVNERVERGRARERELESRYKDLTDNELLKEIRGKGEANTSGLISMIVKGLLGTFVTGIGLFGKDFAEMLRGMAPEEDQPSKQKSNKSPPLDTAASPPDPGKANTTSKSRREVQLEKKARQAIEVPNVSKESFVGSPDNFKVDQRRPMAEGGFVDGPGDAKSDSIPAELSKGEFVINAEATEHNRPLLEYINDTRVDVSAPQEAPPTRIPSNNNREVGSHINREPTSIDQSSVTRIPQIANKYIGVLPIKQDTATNQLQPNDWSNTKPYEPLTTNDTAMRVQPSSEDNFGTPFVKQMATMLNEVAGFSPNISNLVPPEPSMFNKGSKLNNSSTEAKKRSAEVKVSTLEPIVQQAQQQSFNLPSKPMSTLNIPSLTPSKIITETNYAPI